jgi:hypothetical protein
MFTNEYIDCILCLLQGVAETGVLPAGYIGVPANVQQFMGNQGAIRPSIVYMVPVRQNTAAC